MYFYGDYTRHTIRRNFFDINFKYSKSGGEGKFHIIRDKATPGQAIRFVFLYAIMSAAEIPFILFFSDGAKAAVGFSVFIISPVIQLVLVTKGYSHRIKRAKYEKEVEDRELDEQKRREEMGKWK